MGNKYTVEVYRNIGQSDYEWDWETVCRTQSLFDAIRFMRKVRTDVDGTTRAVRLVWR